MNHDHSTSCKDLLSNLSDYIDGDLNDELCQELQRHMAGCENCRVVFDTMTKTIYLYRASTQETVLPVDVRGRLFETLHLDDLLKPNS
ncbi:MAG: zf-HC2 domain-containing protein [Chloroflexi bacterium]|nr:zf-HC2 domain-containing protein [Chloroflexota bacterium]